jgi:hypothetical protein
MRFSIQIVLIACLFVGLFMTMLPYFLEWRRLEVRFQNSQNSVWRIKSLGGRVEEFGMSKIPATFFLKNSENSIVPESMKDIEVTGVLTSAHDLGRLPESVERLWLTLTSDAIPSIPKFESVRSLRIVLISETGNPRISSDAAALLRSKFTTRLSTLSLFGNAMSDEVVHQFRDCKTLETLHVGGESFTGYGFAQWPAQKALTRCYVAGRIENKHLLQFPALPNATFLEISSEAQLSGGLKWLRNCPKISHLTLAGTGVEPVGFQEVAKLPELSTLSLRALKNIDFSELGGTEDANEFETTFYNYLVYGLRHLGASPQTPGIFLAWLRCSMALSRDILRSSSETEVGSAGTQPMEG